MILLSINKHIVIALVLIVVLVNLFLSEPELPDVSATRRHMLVDEKPLRELNILALGGSVTWGAQATRPYPTLLQFEGHNVTNLAVRGTGSDYPALCIKSMLDDYQRSKNTLNPNESFDVIILEFSVNGLIHFNLLLKRLKERYPDAIFIYVDLISLRSNPVLNDLELAKVGESVGNLFSFPKPKSRDNSAELKWFKRLFANDMHHINNKGHLVVKDNILKIISNADIVDHPKLGSWHGGDTCHSIFQTGQTLLKISGDAMLTEFDTNKHQFAIEVGRKGAIFTFLYDGKQDADLLFGYMTKCTNAQDPSTSLYPPVLVKIAQTNKEIQQAKKEFESDAIRATAVKGKNNEYNVNAYGWTYLDSLYTRVIRRMHHNSQTSVVGVLRPGVNFIYVQPTEERINPFRVISTAVCDACRRMNHENAQVMR